MDTNPVLVAVVGGLLAIAGALSAGWLQARKSLRTRMNQVIAERKVSANADAYKYLKMIETYLSEHTDAEALALMLRHEDWMLANRLFLPASFAELWTSLRTTLRWLTEDPEPHDVETSHRLRLQALKRVREATSAIYQDMDFENGAPDFKAPA